MLLGNGMSTATPEHAQRSGAASGVTSERLAAAVHAAAASMPLPPPIPPNADEIIRQFAQNLGLSEDRVQAAITQVEGNGRFYFAVPLPGFGR